MMTAEGEAENLLLPLGTCSWRDDDMPLERRGVDGNFVWQLIEEVQEQRNRAVACIYSQQRASIHLDNVPWPGGPRDMAEELTVNRHPNLTLDRRPILTPSGDGFWRRAGQGAIRPGRRTNVPWPSGICLMSFEISEYALRLPSRAIASSASPDHRR
jgi:hypothetical protein